MGKNRALHRRRTGMSVVEVIVALMLVTAGLLAVAGSSALALRTSLDAARRRHAVQRMASRIAQLASAGCAGISPGSSTDSLNQSTERWFVVDRGAAFVVVSDTITWMGPRGRVTRALDGAIPC